MEEIDKKIRDNMDKIEEEENRKLCLQLQSYLKENNFFSTTIEDAHLIINNLGSHYSDVKQYVRVVNYLNMRYEIYAVDCSRVKIVYTCNKGYERYLYYYLSEDLTGERNINNILVDDILAEVLGTT